MKHILAIWVIIVLIGLLMISLINLPEYGASGLILAGISSFALYRLFKFMFEDSESDELNEARSPKVGGASDPLEYIIFSNITKDEDQDDW